MASQGPPYQPTVWVLGGPPTKRVDVPVQSVFLFLYICGAVTHMAIFQKNRRRRHKFIPNAAIFGFCMARITTSVLRIASVCLPHNIQLAITAQIFVAAGILIVFIINLIFTMRLVRATHPPLGWHPAFSIAFRVLCVLVIGTLVALITATVQSFYTLNTSTRSKDRDVQLYGATFFAVIATLPIPITLLSLLVPYTSSYDRFGTGRLRTKVIVLLTGSTLLALGAWYRCGTSLRTPVPRTQALPAYMGKAPFYVFNFLVEFIVVFWYAGMRIDQRWYIPNGAKGPGSYSKAEQLDSAEMQGVEADSANTQERMPEDKESMEQDHHRVGRSADKEIDVEKARPS